MRTFRSAPSAAGDLDTRAGKEAHAAAMRAWVEQVYAAAEGEVRTFVDVLQAGAEVAEGDAQATAAIYAVGEVALLGAAPVPGQLSGEDCYAFILIAKSHGVLSFPHPLPPTRSACPGPGGAVADWRRGWGPSGGSRPRAGLRLGVRGQDGRRGRGPGQARRAPHRPGAGQARCPRR